MIKSQENHITGVKASTIALFEATLAFSVGLAVAILYSLKATIAFAQDTSSVLTGLAFGLATGVVSIIVLPLVYFGIGWLVGFVHGWVFNAIVGIAGRITIYTEK